MSDYCEEIENSVEESDDSLSQYRDKFMALNKRLDRFERFNDDILDVSLEEIQKNLKNENLTEEESEQEDLNSILTEDIEQG